MNFRLLLLFWSTMTFALAGAENSHTDPGCFSSGSDYFADELWVKVGARTCIKCHKSGGDAEDSEFILLEPVREGALAHNREAFTKMATVREEGGGAKMLLKVIGELDHGGEEVFAKDSTRYQILERFVRRVNGEGQDWASETSGRPFYEGVQMMAGRKLLRRLTLQLGARLPRADEYAAVEARGLAGVSEMLGGLMNEEAFYGRLAEGFNDIFLTPGIDDVAENVLSYEHFEKTRISVISRTSGSARKLGGNLRATTVSRSSANRWNWLNTSCARGGRSARSSPRITSWSRRTARAGMVSSKR